MDLKQSLPQSRLVILSIDSKRFFVVRKVVFELLIPLPVYRFTTILNRYESFKKNGFFNLTKIAN